MQSTLQFAQIGVATKTNLCYACLSTDRKLNVLGELEEIYLQICPSTSWDLGIQLCWECRALLRNVKHFQIKAKNAQHTLRTCSSNLPTSLSSLSFFTKVEEDYPNLDKTETKNHLQKIEKVQKYEIDEDEIDLPQVIKTELEIEYPDNQEDFYYDEPVEEIKDENLPETILEKLQDITVKKAKKKPADRTRPYKMTHRKFDKVVTRIPINEEDIESWIEKEKNSTFYKHTKLKCDKCVTTLHKNNAKHHHKVHSKSKETPFACKICQHCFARKCELEYHLQEHYTYYRCDICEYTCYKRLNMRYHLKSLHSRVVKCLQCELTFTNTRKFYDHYKSAHTVFICDYCNKRFKTKKAIEGHIYRWHAKHKCSQCSISFGSYRTYSEHIKLKHRIERSEATYCVQCDLQFDTAPLFRRHVTTTAAHRHENKNRYGDRRAEVKCLECPRVYARKTYMMNHYRQVHSKRTKNHCTICDKRFTTGWNYRNHMKYSHERREKERNKICNVCGRGFYNNRILDNHVRTHTGERPFECQLCDARFAQKTALTTHVRFIHLKNKRKPNANYQNAPPAKE